MPCAVVQQLPHVSIGVCDWTVGGVGGEMHWFSFCDLRWQCSLSKKMNYIILGKVEIIF
jgi:hypothetical protein